jgi:catechol 2,3-dioxygenase-like lactoylglutathione lyase family enzyme
MTITAFDHVALPMERIDEMLAFYTGLGFTVDDAHAPILYAVVLGDMKLNLHCPKLWRSERFELRGPTAQPGCGDICFVWAGTHDDLVERLAALDATVIEGPVDRVGGRSAGTATGTSRYVRDPDGNLLEFIVY